MLRGGIGDYFGLIVEMVTCTCTRFRQLQVLDLSQHRSVVVLSIDRLSNLSEDGEACL